MMPGDSQPILATTVSGRLGLGGLSVVLIMPAGTQTRRESWFDPELTRLVMGGPRTWLQWSRGPNAS